MHLKDYYAILELPPSASMDEIKKSYRRLAHLYHPDKKNDDPYAAVRFTEIKEAYETLTNPYKKDLYLQQRWYAQSIGKKKTGSAVTPESLLKQMLELERYSSQLDIHRMDKEGLYHYLVYVLSDQHIEQLNAFNEPGINKEIIRCAIKTGHMVPFNLLTDVVNRLNRINIPGALSTDEIGTFYRQRKQMQYWEKRKIWIILLIVLVVCAGIFILARN